MLYSTPLSCAGGAVEKLFSWILGRDAEKNDPIEYTTINDLMFGMSQVPLENTILTRQKDFSYRLVRQGQIE